MKKIIVDALFYVRFPGSPNLLSFRAPNEKQARKAACEFANVNRLPSGTEVWRSGEYTIEARW